MRNVKEISCETSNSNLENAIPCKTGTESSAVEDPVTVVMRTNSIVRALALIMQHHGAKSDIRQLMTDQVHEYLDNSDNEKVWLKKAKSLLTYPMADYLRNARPSEPDGGYFEPRQRFRKWWKNRILIFSRKNTHLWYSWLQAKRSALPLSDDMVDSTYDDHYTSLTRSDPGDPAVIDQIFDNYNFCMVLEFVRDAVRRRFNGYEFESATSTSACFEASRSQGGQCDRLRELSGIPSVTYSTHQDPSVPGGKTYSIDSVHLSPDELVSMSWVPCSYGTQKRSNVHLEDRRSAGLDLWKTELLDQTSTFLRETGQTPINCTIQAVLEPFKVRVISKGEALPYYNCKPLQEILRETLAELPCFRLLGRPFSPDDLIDLGKMVNPGDEWFSVDYSAATDGLSWNYSGRILEYLIQDLPESYKTLCLKVLGPHRLSYPTRNGPVEFKGVQRNGQLMGSILSFPILCLANLGVYLAVNAWRQTRWSDEEILNHVLINGDDMVYAAPSYYWEDHVRIARAVGLEMSVGKAYHHKTYANINSTSVHYDIPRVFNEPQRVTPWQIDFLNTGLYFGSRKVQTKDSVEVSEERKSHYAAAHISANPDAGFSVNINTILQGCLPGRQNPILASYLALHREELKAETCFLLDSREDHENGKKKFCFGYFSRNLFLPISLGGMGQKAPPGFRFQISAAQRELIRININRMMSLGLDINFDYPLRGYEVKDIQQTLCPFSKVVSEPEFTVLRDRVKVSKKNAIRKQLGKIQHKSLLAISSASRFCVIQ